MAIWYAFWIVFLDEWGHWSLGILDWSWWYCSGFGGRWILQFQGMFLDSVFSGIHWIHHEWFVFSWLVMQKSGNSQAVAVEWFSITLGSSHERDLLSKTPQKIEEEVFKFKFAQLQRTTCDAKKSSQSSTLALLFVPYTLGFFGPSTYGCWTKNMVFTPPNHPFW